MDQDNTCSELYDQIQAVADSLPAPIFVLDYDGRYVNVFGGRSRSHYDSGQGLIGCYMQDVLPEEKWKLFLDVVRKAIDTGTLQTCDYILDSAEVCVTETNGPAGPQWFHGRVYPVASHPGKKPAAVWLAINVSEQKAMEERLQRLSERDDLTGAYNRRYFMQRLKNEYELARRRQCDLSLISLDIDHFKAINDRFGHIEGDRALQHLTNTIRPQLRETDILARIGGEEFAILCLSTDLNKAWSVAERIRQSIESSELKTDRGVIHMRISLGLATVNPQDTSIHALLSQADKALYQAKDTGRNRTCGPSPEAEKHGDAPRKGKTKEAWPNGHPSG
jgi:diguanylate cyclase (GGDEF)-like protein